MKTTVEISDTLLEAAKKRAREQRTTLRDCIESALKRFLDQETEQKPHRMKDRTFRVGKGSQPGVNLRNWEQIRGMIYEGHGE